MITEGTILYSYFQETEDGHCLVKGTVVKRLPLNRLYMADVILEDNNQDNNSNESDESNESMKFLLIRLHNRM